MFNSLYGVITGKFPKQVFIETNGIEWDLCVPDSNLDMLPNVGQEGRIYTWLQHTENAMTLYGFASAEERMLFLDLLKVDGIGAKGAVKIMSAVSSERLSTVLENGDLEMLEKIPGVGKKTAGKMLLALKGKLTVSGGNTKTISVNPKNDAYSVVVQGLVEMGYDKIQTQKLVADIVASMEGDEAFAKMNQTQKEDVIFKKALTGALDE